MGNRNKMDYTKRFGNPVKNEHVEETPIETTTDEVVEITEEPVEETQPQVFTKEGIVDIAKNQSLNLREDMDANANIVKTLNNKESVIIDNEYHDWYHVITESGAEGFVMSKYIKLV